MYVIDLRDTKIKISLKKDAFGTRIKSKPGMKTVFVVCILLISLMLMSELPCTTALRKGPLCRRRGPVCVDTGARSRGQPGRCEAQGKQCQRVHNRCRCRRRNSFLRPGIGQN